jgi:hypothetical protein
LKQKQKRGDFMEHIDKQKDKLAKRVDFFEIKKHYITVVKPREERREEMRRLRDEQFREEMR